MKNEINADHKYCSYGKHYVHKDKFYNHPTGTYGKLNICIECISEKRKETRRKTKEGTIKAF